MDTGPLIKQYHVQGSALFTVAVIAVQSNQSAPWTGQDDVAGYLLANSSPVIK
jgi:hypothetical protein